MSSIPEDQATLLLDHRCPTSDESPPSTGRHCVDKTCFSRLKTQSVLDKDEIDVRILHVNIQSMRRKILDLEVLISEGSYDVICINEHWLKSEELSLVNVEGYHVISSFCRSEGARGGGVCVFVRNPLVCNPVDMSYCTTESHFEAAGVFLVDYDTYVFSVYRTPNSSYYEFTGRLSALLDKINISKYKITVAGDFNVHLSTSNVRTVGREAEDLCSLMATYGLRQTVFFNTRLDACLDNVFTNFPDAKYSVGPLDTSHLSDHIGVQFSFRSADRANIHGKTLRINYRPVSDLGLFRFYNTVELMDWSFVSDPLLDIETKFNLFFNELTEVIEICFPQKTRLISTGRRYVACGWFDESLAHMRERLRTLTGISRIDPALVPKSMVQSYKKHYRKEISNRRRKYTDDLINRANNRQASMWKVIKGNNPVNTADQYDTCLNAEIFNEFFTSVADRIVGELPHSTSSFDGYLTDVVQDGTSGLFEFRQVTFNEVRQSLAGVKDSNARDCYGFNTKIVKTVKNLIVYPLTGLINHCIASGHFPSVLKVARVTPVYKNRGSRDDCNNYRPISILPILSKVFESLLKSQIVGYFETTGLFLPCQFGFRERRSTTLAIDNLTRHILNAFENSLDTYASFYDLTKAFDCISHSILLKKLEHYKFSANSVKLIESYFINRTQFVHYNSNTSQKRVVRHGVPQGSVLGPILFLIYINDLANFRPDVGLVLFADDTTTYTSYHPSTDIESVVLDVQSSANEWFLANRLSLNTSKTQNINFSLRNIETQLQTSESVKFLGVYLDSKLTWREHVTHLINKLASIVYLIRNLAGIVSREVLMLAYHGYFASNMTYALLGWGHSAHAPDVFRLQRRCVRVIAGLGYRDCCRRQFTEYKILTLPCAYILQCLLYIKRNRSLFIQHDSVHDYPTRHSSNVMPEFFRLGKSRTGTSYYCVKFFNKLPSEVRALDELPFKSRVKNYLINRAFYNFNEFLTSNCDDI